MLRKHVLPADAFPPGTSAHDRRRAERRIRPFIGQVPRTPGTYRDGTGEPWILNADGSWTDKHGETRPAEYAPVLAVFIRASGPFVREHTA